MAAIRYINRFDSRIELSEHEPHIELICDGCMEPFGDDPPPRFNVYLTAGPSEIGPEGVDAHPQCRRAAILAVINGHLPDDEQS